MGLQISSTLGSEYKGLKTRNLTSRVQSKSFFIAASNSTDIDAGDIWVDATPAEVNALAVPAGFKDIILVDDDIVSACATQNTNAGAIRLDCYWRPLSVGATVVAA